MSVTTIFDPISGRTIFVTSQTKSADLMSSKIVANIAERDGVSEIDRASSMIWVEDATDDPTVKTGSAGYIWKASSATWIKIFESETMDTVPGGTVPLRLLEISDLDAVNNDIIQQKSGAWTHRTPAQLKADMTFSSSDVSLNNVTNDAQVKRTEMAAVLGVATLDVNGNLVQSIAASKVTGVLNIDNIPPAALERIFPVANDTERFLLTTASVQNGDTVKVAATGALYIVKDTTHLSSEAGYEVYTASTASTVPWTGVQSIPAPVSQIAAITSSDNDFMVKISGVWSNRTVAQVKTLLNIPTFFSGSFSADDSTGFVWTGNVLTITHNLNSKNLNVNLTDTSGNACRYNILYSTTNTISIAFPLARVPIIGSYTIRIN